MRQVASRRVGVPEPVVATWLWQGIQQHLSHMYDALLQPCFFIIDGSCWNNIDFVAQMCACKNPMCFSGWNDNMLWECCFDSNCKALSFPLTMSSRKVFAPRWLNSSTTRRRSTAIFRAVFYFLPALPPLMLQMTLLMMTQALMLSLLQWYLVLIPPLLIFVISLTLLHPPLHLFILYG